jgi:hypothetical protein
MTKSLREGFMDEGVMSFKNIRINNDLLNEIWAFDPRELDHVDGIKLSSYAVCLAQYLIYFTYQRNLAKAEQYKKNKYIDRTISLIISSDKDLQKLKPKTAATDLVISTNECLIEAQTYVDALQQELNYIEGVDKVVSELIATIKRELTRRESELYQSRAERR